MRATAVAVVGLVLAIILPLILVATVVGAMSATITDTGPATPFTGDRNGCTATDPTGGRCLTQATRHAYDEVVRIFGVPNVNGPIRSAGCWDAHAWNPDSDHSKGRACDFFSGIPGLFARGVELANGWRLANWLRINAAALGVGYIIWQGRIWSPGTTDTDGWGKRYDGGGIYDPHDPTGGHYDHIHLSIRA